MFKKRIGVVAFGLTLLAATEGYAGAFKTVTSFERGGKKTTVAAAAAPRLAEGDGVDGHTYHLDFFMVGAGAKELWDAMPEILRIAEEGVWERLHITPGIAMYYLEPDEPREGRLSEFGVRLGFEPRTPADIEFLDAFVADINGREIAGFKFQMYKVRGFFTVGTVVAGVENGDGDNIFPSIWRMVKFHEDFRVNLQAITDYHDNLKAILQFVRRPTAGAQFIDALAKTSVFSTKFYQMGFVDDATGSLHLNPFSYADQIDIDCAKFKLEGYTCYAKE